MKLHAYDDNLYVSIEKLLRKPFDDAVGTIYVHYEITSPSVIEEALRFSDRATRVVQGYCT